MTCHEELYHLTLSLTLTIIEAEVEAEAGKNVEAVKAEI